MNKLHAVTCHPQLYLKDVQAFLMLGNLDLCIGQLKLSVPQVGAQLLSIITHTLF